MNHRSIGSCCDAGLPDRTVGVDPGDVDPASEASASFGLLQAAPL